MNPARVKRLGVIALLLAFLTLLVIAYLSYLNWRYFQTAAQSIQHTREIIDLNTQVREHLTEAETGQRGFLLTGRTEYLEPYHRAVARVGNDLDKLSVLLTGVSEQETRAAALRSLARIKLEELRHTIELRQSNGLAAALSLVDSDLGKQTMDKLNAVLGDVESAEEDSRQAAWDALQDHAQQARWLTLFGSVLLAGLVAGGGLALSRSARQQEALTLAAESARDLLGTTLHSIGDAVIATDTEGRVTFLNPAAQTLTGFDEASAVGHPIEEVFRIVNEETRSTVESPVRRVLREGRVVGLANHTVLVSRSGADIPIDDSGAPIRSRGGRIEGAVLVFRDVTARRKADQEIQLSERRFRLLADSAPAMICSDNAAQQREFCNAGWLQFTGRTLEQESGEGWKEGIHPEDRARREEVFARAYEAREAYSIEFRLRRQDGTYAWVLGRAAPRFGVSAEFQGYLACYIDVDDQRRTQERLRQSAKLESLGVLAGGIAHDFNNILVAIMGNASLLEESFPAGDANRELLSNIVKASERAAMLTRQMLAYSGKGRFVVEPLDLSEQVRQIVELLRASIPKHVSVQLELADGLPLVEADGTQMQQLVMNLVINGAEAIASGPGTVVVRTGMARVGPEDIGQWVWTDDVKPGEYVVLSVQDNGSGMDAGTQARVFDPFFTTKFTGRGLGLAAAQGIVRGHSGGIRLISAPGQGTTFQVFLPPAAARQKPAPKRAPAHTRGSGLVLVVDDENMVQEAARRTLERAGYTVISASDGASALDLLERHRDRIRLVILDMTMPGLSGEETLEQMRSICPDVPVVLSSGYGETLVTERFGSRIDAFLPKPYTAAEFDRAIQDVLAGRRGREFRAGS